LREAPSSLDRDPAFLEAGDVFEMTPHPVEFDALSSLLSTWVIKGRPWRFECASPYRRE
jgi:hypothetical protein